MSDSELNYEIDKLKTEIKRLRRRETLFDAMQKLAGFGYCEWDYKNGCISTCTPEFAKIFNLSIEEVLDSQQDWDTTLDVIHPSDRELYAKSYEQSSGLGAHEVEYRIVRKDGQIRYVWEILVLVDPDDREGSDSVALLQDITERKVHEQELEKRDALVGQVEAITDIGHFIWDVEEEDYRYLSPGFARIHGKTVESYQQEVKTWEDDIADVHADDYEMVAEIYRKAQAENSDYLVEYRIWHTDGALRWIQEQGTIMQNPATATRQTVGVLKDITRQKEIELELLEEKDSLESLVEDRTRELADTIAQLKQEISRREKVSHELELRNAELERFTYTVSHDLKSPLVTIKGFLGLLNQDLAKQDFDRVEEDVSRVNNAADVMGSLLNDLLELSRIGRVMNDPVACDLTDLAKNALKMVSTRINDLEIEVEIDNMPGVEGDELRLTEVFQNLLENTTKFMGEQKSPRVHIGATEENGMVNCFVRDNGIGIAPVYHQQIFRLFERLHANIQGTGIGLALVKRIVEAHGGIVKVESDGEGQGSSFIFSLPKRLPAYPAD